MSFYEKVCQINEHIDSEEIEQIFTDIKSFLYEQFQNEVENANDE